MTKLLDWESQLAKVAKLIQIISLQLSSLNLINSIKLNIEKTKKSYLKNINTLEAVSPLAVLSRGYSIVTDDTNKIITSSEELNINQKIKARFQKGEILAQILNKIDED